MRLRLLVPALVVCAALYAAMHASLRIGPAFTGLNATTEGHFTEGGGWFAGEPFVTAHPVRAWGSWNGSDEHTGRLSLGPFPAPAHLRFAVGGYPPYPGNTLRLENEATGERLVLQPPAVGERWRILDQTLPPAWRGQPIRIVAVDEARAIGGWLAVTEPIRGGVGDGVAGLWLSLAAWAINGVLLGLLWSAAARLLAPRRLVPAPWLPLLAFGAVALLGVLSFWAWFAHPRLGAAFSVLVLLAAIVVHARTRPTEGEAATDLAAVARLLVLVGVFYLALLHLLPSSLDFYQLAANRFRPTLPTDNELPFEAASRLAAGELLRRAEADWLSSDRPPLQSGWQLLTWPVLTALQLPARAGSGTAAVWLQLGWVAAAFGLLRTLRLGRGPATAWVVVLALSGFLLQNTVFTWPKLSAAALAAGAFGLWVLTPAADAAARRRHLLMGAGLAGLAWLSHGGVAFSFLALAPWLVWRAARGEWPDWARAALLFAALALPWMAYQKFYDPPGNRLLKWHLGGQIPKDARGVWQTIRENYAALPPGRAWENKRRNLALQADGRWGALLEYDAPRATDRRNQEFFLSGRALTWWAFGLLLLPWVWRRVRAAVPTAAGSSATEAVAPPGMGPHFALLAWVAGTLLVWCLLMFDANQAVVHQGSYAMMLGAFVLLSAWFAWAGRAWLPVVAALQAVTLVTTWLPGNTVVDGDPLPQAAGLALLAAAGLAVVAWRGAREGDPMAADSVARGRPHHDDSSDRVAALERSDHVVSSPATHSLRSGAATPSPATPHRVAEASRLSPTWPRATGALLWIAAGVALLPAVWCAPALADLWWFGDDWDLLDQIQRMGFWRWTLVPFAENFVPLFKVLWGGLVFAGGGAYWPLVTALWLTHALNTALFLRLLRAGGVDLAGAILATALFGLAAFHVESLAWSVQWSALLATTFFLLAAQRLSDHLRGGAAPGSATLAALALLSAASALCFSRGVITGAALAAACLLPAGGGTGRGPAALRWRAALACLLPALAVAAVIAFSAGGNHRAPAGHLRAAAEFALCHWSVAPLYRLLGCVTWHWPLVLGLGAIKGAVIVAAFRRTAPPGRTLLWLLLAYDLGNAALLGLGRHHTGLPAANSERYYYPALLGFLPFLGLAFAGWLQPLPGAAIRRAFAAGVVLLWTAYVAHGWPAAAEQFAVHRGRNTRELLLRAPNPPAEGAVPGIPFLPTARAKELIAAYGLH